MPNNTHTHTRRHTDTNGHTQNQRLCLYLAFGLHVQQQVVDDVQDHGVLHGVGGDLQLVVDEGEGVHGPWGRKPTAEHGCVEEVAGTPAKQARNLGPPPS